MIPLAHILGQPAAIGGLTAALAADRLSHALLFAGPAGVGKGTAAEAVAAVFLCDAPKAGVACGRCRACIVMAAGTHPDFHRIYRQLARHLKRETVARDISVEVIREFLIEPAIRTSAMGRGKAFVIEEADRMSTQAQNGLLKILEEPPGRAMIILLAETPDFLLPTIRSRCQRVVFGELPAEIIAGELARRGVDEGTARESGLLAGGSLGTAIRLAQGGLLAIARDIAERVTATLTGKGAGDLPKAFKSHADALAEQIMDADPDGSKDQATRESLGLICRLGSDSCRRHLRAARTAGGMARLCTAIERFSAAGEHLEANVSVPLVLQQLAAELEGA